MNEDLNSEYLLNVDDSAGLADFLGRHGYLLEGEKLEHLELAGSGNMNIVLRAVTDQRSFILKQSLPWVCRYPQQKAPRERILTEYAFYETVRANESIRKLTPEMYWLDTAHFLLCMEDLGQAHDFMHLYKKGQDLERSDMANMVKMVSELHSNFKYDSKEVGIRNLEMRELNHTHVFDLPLNKDNGFNLDGICSGLQAATDTFRNNEKLRNRALELGEIYLADTGTRLLHGDYYPGSWLKTSSGFKMIDPEFCFKGPAEFELAVAMAHLKMAQQPESILKELFIHYRSDSEFDHSLFSKFIGIEIIRRLMGLAQLPLELDLKERLNLLDEAYELVLNG